jgi:hypothetical protein
MTGDLDHMCECEGELDICLSCMLHEATATIADHEAALAELRARVETEIAWLDAMAGSHLDAQSEAANRCDIEEAVIHNYEAKAYRTAAERLRTALHGESRNDW